MSGGMSSVMSIGVCSSGRGMITAGQGLVAIIGIGCGDSRSSVGGIVRGANVVSSNTSSSSGNGASDFGIAKGLVPAAALPELHSASASIVVAGSGAEALLFLVMAAQGELNEGGDEEEDSSKNGDREASRVQPASSSKGHCIGDFIAEALLRAGRAASERRIHSTAAALCAIAGENSNSNKSSGKKKVEDNSEEGEDSLSPETASEEDSKEGIKNGGSRNALNSLKLFRDGNVSVRENGQEVTVNTED